MSNIQEHDSATLRFEAALYRSPLLRKRYVVLDAATRRQVIHKTDNLRSALNAIEWAGDCVLWDRKEQRFTE